MILILSLSLILFSSFVFNLYFFLLNDSSYTFGPQIQFLDSLVQSSVYTGLTALMAILTELLLIWLFSQSYKPLKMMLSLLNENQESEALRDYLKQTR